MPELPEVEAARSAIADHCIGKKIIKAIIANDSKVIHGISSSHFESSLLNKTIVAAHRKGKNMWLQLDSRPFPSFQFGMAGAVYIKGVPVTKYKRSAVNDTDEWPSKYSKFFVELNDGLEVSFTDTRRFAKVRLLDDPASVPPISELGPDALLEPMTQEEFYKSLSKKKIAIKTLLLDQSFISGIGNWIADEVLYQAGIHPLQPAFSFSKNDSARLQKSIKEVIERAVEVGADSSQYPSSWIFHSREKKPGNGKAFVDGKKIDFITVGGRTTAIVPELQTLTGEQAIKAPAKPRKQTSKKKSNDDDTDANGEENDDNDGAAVDSDNGEEERGELKSKQTKNSKGGVKKPPRRKKTTKSNDDDDDDDETIKSSGSKVPAKRKSRGEGKKEPGETNDSDVGDEDGDERRAIKVKGQKPQVKMQTRKKAK